jgi:hypothetical protein
MKYQVLQKPLEYKNCPIVIRRFGENFEYITCINNQIYSSYITARQNFLRKIFGLGYTAENKNKITNYVIAMAQTTIDSVNGTPATELAKEVESLISPYQEVNK